MWQYLVVGVAGVLVGAMITYAHMVPATDMLIIAAREDSPLAEKIAEMQKGCFIVDDYPLASRDHVKIAIAQAKRVCIVYSLALEHSPQLARDVDAFYGWVVAGKQRPTLILHPPGQRGRAIHWLLLRGLRPISHPQAPISYVIEKTLPDQRLAAAVYEFGYY